MSTDTLRSLALLAVFSAVAMLPEAADPAVSDFLGPDVVAGLIWISGFALFGAFWRMVYKWPPRAELGQNVGKIGASWFVALVVGLIAWHPLGQSAREPYLGICAIAGWIGVDALPALQRYFYAKLGLTTPANDDDASPNLPTA